MLKEKRRMATDALVIVVAVHIKTKKNVTETNKKMPRIYEAFLLYYVVFIMLVI